MEMEVLPMNIFGVVEVRGFCRHKKTPSDVGYQRDHISVQIEKGKTIAPISSHYYLYELLKVLPRIFSCLKVGYLISSFSAADFSSV